MVRRTLIALLAAAAFAAPASANLIVNGGFELSNSPTVTPTGWTQIGHSDGVIAYSQFGPAAYEGLNFYDFGGFGNPFGPSGDGLEQTVATITGQTYTLTFGLSSENSSGVTVLDVLIGSQLTQFTLTVGPEGVFQKNLTGQSISYVATGPSTVIRFIESVGGGSNDPLIDAVDFDLAQVGVPEPGVLGLLGLGLTSLMLGARRRRG